MATAREEKQLVDRGEGCLGKSDPDEPVFILRAQDAAFAAGVMGWINEARRLGAPEAKTREAHDIVQAAIDWQRANPDRVKVPD
jgi:hypothetical protein